MEAPDSTRMNTRATNKDVHPGQPDMDEETLRRPIPKPRRTKVEILAVKLAKEAKKQERAAAAIADASRRAAGVKDIARFENKLELDAIQSKKEASRPSLKISMKISRPTEVPVEEDLTLDLSGDESDPEDAEISAEVNPGADDGAYHDGFEEDIVHESTDEVVTPATNKGKRPVKAKPAKKPVVVGESVRNAINKHKSELTSGAANLVADLSDDERDTVGTKRKPPPDAASVFGPNAKRGKPSPLGPGYQPNRPSGLIPGWRNSISRSGSFTSSNASSPTQIDFDDSPSGTPTPTGRKAVQDTTEEPVSRFDYGGYEDEDEAKEAAMMTSNRPANELKPLVKVHRPSSNRVKAEDPELGTFFSIPSTSRGTKSPHVVFNNNDLPAGTLQRWTKVFIPSWMQYVGSVPKPWVLSMHLQAAQCHWDNVFPAQAQVLALKGDPIFAVLKQHTYEWRSSFMTAAITAVQAFWDSDEIYSDPLERAAYVEWAFPEDPNEPTPGIWANVDDDFEDISDYVYKGAFQAPAVISTFAQHLLLLRSVQDSMLINVYAEGALALSATAVEHAFRRWKTGHNAGKSDFSSALSEKTDLYTEDIATKLTSKSWVKILTAAERTLEAPAQLGGSGRFGRSARAVIVDADSD